MNTQLFVDLLKKLHSSSVDIEVSAVMTTDGVLLASQLKDPAQEDLLGVVSATLLATGRRVAQELQGGVLEHVILKGNKGYLFVMDTGKDVALGFATGESAKLGLVLLEAQRVMTDLVNKMYD